MEENNTPIEVEVTPVEQTPAPQNDDQPGKGLAIASLILGIIAASCVFFGTGAIAGVVCGIVGLVLNSKAKNAGFAGGLLKAGFILNLIGLIASAVSFVIGIACTACMAAAGVGEALTYDLSTLM